MVNTSFAARTWASALALTLALALFAACSAQAATYTWDDTVNPWNTGHWLPGPVAGPTGASNANSAIINSGTVTFAQHDTFGNDATPSSPVITVNGGSLASNGWFTTIWDLNMGGGTLLASGGANGSFPAFQIAGTLTVSGSTASTINVGGGSNNMINVGGNGNGTLTLNVADVTGNANADLTINNVLQNRPSIANSLTKTGAGTLTLSGTSTYSGVTTVSGGTLLVTGALTGNGKFQVNGGANLTFNTPGRTSTFTSTAFRDIAIGCGAVGSATLTDGTVNVNGIGTGNSGLVVGENSGTGTLTVNGGALNVQNWLLMGRNVANDSGTLTINGGQVNVGYLGGYTGPGTTGPGTLYLGNFSPGSIVNLNGGTLAMYCANGGSQGSFNFNGGTLKAVANNSLFFNAVTLPLVVQGGGAIIDDGGFAITITNALTSGASPDGGLTKTGAGTLTLTANNTFTGATNVNAGTLALAGSGSLYNNGTAAGQVYVNNGGTLRFDRNDTFGNHLAYPVARVTVNAGGTVASNNTFTTLTDLALAGGTVLSNGGANTSFGSFALKGTVTVSGSAASSMVTGTGSNNVIAIGTNAAGGATTFNVADVTGDANADLTVGTVLTDNRNSGYALVAGGLTKTGAGTMVLSAANTYTGNTVVNAGQVRVTGSLTGAAAGTRFIIGSGSGNNASMVFDMGSGTSTFYADGYGNSCDIGENSGTGALTLESGTLAVGTRTSGSFGSLRLGCNGTASGTLTVNGGQLTLPGRILMSANNAATVGVLTINGGSVILGTAGNYNNSADPGNGTVWMGNGTSTVNLNGGTLSLFSFRGGAAKDTLNFNGGTLQAVANNTDITTGGTMTMVVKSGGARIDTQAFNIAILEGLIHDSGLGVTPDGGLAKSGVGTLTLSGPSTFTGNVTVNAGELQAAGASGVNPAYSALGNPQLASRTITVNTGGTLRFITHDVMGNASSTPQAGLFVAGGTVTNNGGQFTTLGPVTLNGGTLTGTGGANASYQLYYLTGGVQVIGSASSTISGSGSNSGYHLATNTIFNVADVTGDANGDLFVSGVLVNQTGNQGNAVGGLTKAGAGTMVLSAVNAYTGSTAVNGGTLLVNGSIASSSGVLVAAGGTLGGTGTVSTVNVAAGGHAAPGTSPGTLHTGSVNFVGGSNLDIELSPTVWDTLDVTGTVNIAGAQLNLSALSSFSHYGGSSYLIVNNDLADAISGVFAGLGEGATIESAGNQFAITYVGGTGNDIVLTAVPEPASLALLGLAAASLGGYIRRRR